MSQNAEPPTAEAWCLFQVRSRPHAVPLGRVVEIVTVEHLARFPLGPKSLLGLFVLRRDVVPVVDLDPAPLGDPSFAEGKAVVLVLQTDHGMWGVRIDREGTLLVQASPESEGGPGPSRPGRIVNEGKTYSIIDPEAVWRQTRASVVAQYRPASEGTGLSARGPSGTDDAGLRPEPEPGFDSVIPVAFSPKVLS